MGRTCLDISQSCCFYNSVLVLGMGYPWNGSCRSVHSHFQDCSENIEPTRPIAILLAERAPSIDEAWKEAMKDGRISSHESRSLDELQRILGLSDRQMTKVAAKHAIERSLKRNRITTEQYTFIQEAASLYDNDAYVLQLNNIDVESGRLKKSNRMVLESLYEQLEEEE